MPASRLPRPAVLALPADLKERLGRLPHESHYIDVDDVVIVLAGVELGDFTLADRDFAMSRLEAAVTFAAQLETIQTRERRGIGAT